MRYQKNIILLFILVFVLFFYNQTPDDSTQEPENKNIVEKQSHDVHVHHHESESHIQPKSEIQKTRSPNDKLIEANFQNIKRSFPNIKELCKPIPEHLLGIFAHTDAPVNFTAMSLTINTTYGSFLKDLQSGGSWSPKHCQSRHRVAIVIPYRDRLDNLNTWLFNMHPFLQRQELEYTIFVVEQLYWEHYNKGILMNAAFKLIFDKEIGNTYDCILYHDVDMLPTDDLNQYSCPGRKPRHFSILVDEHDYRTEYPQLVGGVIVYMPDHYRKLNGYSNSYWGWGAEDDDMFKRFRKSKVGFERPMKNTKYIMFKHKQRYKNPDRVKILGDDKRPYTEDGLNSVEYKLQGIVKYPMFTHILIDVGSVIQYVAAPQKTRPAPIEMAKVRLS